LRRLLFEEFSGDIVIDSADSSIGLIESSCTKPLDLTPTSSPLLLKTPTNLHAFHASLGDISGSHPSFGLCCVYLENTSKKSCGVLSLIILWIFQWDLVSLRDH